MINPTPHSQTLDYTCGPASLAFVLQHLGIAKSETELVDLCGTTEAGTTRHGIIRALKTLELPYEEKSPATWEDLQRLIKNGTPTLIEWYHDLEEPHEYHYSALRGMDDESICIMDPAIGSYRTLPKDEFLAIWKGYDSSTGTPLPRWYIAIPSPAQALEHSEKIY